MSETPDTTHNELVKRAVRWLRNTAKCSVVVSELVTILREIPDAIGWKGGLSILVECKVTRADYYADKQKSIRIGSRLYPEIDEGMGRERYYLAPKGVLVHKNIPDGWGLLEMSVSGRVRKVVPAPVRIQTNAALRNEMRLMSSALRRYQEAGL